MKKREINLSNLIESAMFRISLIFVQTNLKYRSKSSNLFN